MKMILTAGILATAFALAPLEASAGSINKRKLSVGADLNSPWVLQLKTKRRFVKRRARSGAKKVRVVRQRDNVSYQQTASIGSTNDGLRKSINANVKSDLLPTLVNYQGADQPGTLVVNTIERKLYLVMNNGMARRYAIGVGKPGFEWSGTHKVTRKAQWPDWRPPAEMIAREKKKGRTLPAFMAGGPTNPLGARALYLGSTIYRIHGTTQNWSIGKAVSSGCIRMRNQDVMDLYDRVPTGTKVRVI